MKTITFPLLARLLAFATIPALFSSASSAQTAPMASPTSPVSADALASLNQDVQSLLRQVADLNLQVQSLQQENADLKKQMLTQDQVKSLVQNLVAASRADIDRDIAQSSDDSQKAVLAEVAKEMKALADDTNTQLQKLAKAIGNTPAPRPVTVIPASPTQYGKGLVIKVEKNDSLAKLAKKYNVSQSDIMSANHLTDPNKLFVGQDLFIPQKDGAPAPVPDSVSAAGSGN